MSMSLVNNKYRIVRRIGGGSFGEIYLGVEPNGEKVAVKFERHGARCPQLRHEYKVYRELANCHGFCSVYFFGNQDNYNVMVMDLLGPSLEDLFTKCSRRFSLKTVLQLADQILERVDTLHSRHLIHRDIKPANFVIGLGDAGATVYCVDFGLSKRYRHPKNLQHIPHRDGRSLTGTPRYASINNHLGVEQSRRDDLESVGYVLIYFLKGSLPWQGLKAKNAQKKYRMILDKKQGVSIAQLCQGCPSQFAEFLAYTRSLKFDAKPDIPYLRKLFRDLYHSQGCASVGKLWDWDNINTDYMTTGVEGMNVVGPSGVAQIGTAAMRPTTAAAVAGSGMMDAGDMMLGTELGRDDDEYELRKLPDRPSTAGAMLTRPTQGSWGYPRQTNTQEQVMHISASNPSNDLMKDPRQGVQSNGDGQRPRPHSAHGGRGVAEDPNKMEEEGDAVVAGARAMMRYRRTRTSANEPSIENMGVNKNWNDGSGAPRAIYQNASKPGQVQQQQQQPLMAPNNATYGAAAYGAAATQTSRVKQQQQSTNWLLDRPKSAGVTATSGARLQGQQVQPQQQVLAGVNVNSDANAQSMMYGSLKNRFLSGSKQQAATKSTKLFTR